MQTLLLVATSTTRWLQLLLLTTALMIVSACEYHSQTLKTYSDDELNMPGNANANANGEGIDTDSSGTGVGGTTLPSSTVHTLTIDPLATTDRYLLNWLHLTGTCVPGDPFELSGDIEYDYYNDNSTSGTTSSLSSLTELCGAIGSVNEGRFDIVIRLGFPALATNNNTQTLPTGDIERIVQISQLSIPTTGTATATTQSIRLFVNYDSYCSSVANEDSRIAAPTWLTDHLSMINWDGPIFNGGRGTTDNPFALCNLADFKLLAAPTDNQNPRLPLSATSATTPLTELWGGAFILLGDIIGPAPSTGTSTVATPSSLVGAIGNGTTPFTGQIEGFGHTIGQLTLSQPLFGTIDRGDFLSQPIALNNLTFAHITMTAANKKSGLIVGALIDATLSQIVLSGTNIIDATGKDEIGGVVGVMKKNARITTLTIEGRMMVSGRKKVGGVAGYMKDNAVIDNVTGSIASVSGTHRVGGIAGDMINSATLNTVTFSVLSVLGVEDVGGLIGHIQSDQVLNGLNVTIDEVHGGVHVGGLIGHNRQTTFTNTTPTNTISLSSVTLSCAPRTDPDTEGCISGDSEVGGVIGINDGATLANIDVIVEASGRPAITGTINSDPAATTIGNNIGGVIGINTGNTATVTDVHITGQCSHRGNACVNGNSRIGGLIGSNGDTHNLLGSGVIPGGAITSSTVSLKNIFPTSHTTPNVGYSVLAVTDYAGGLIGDNLNAAITHAHVYAPCIASDVGATVGSSTTNECRSGVTGRSHVGGLIGHNKDTSSLTPSVYPMISSSVTLLTAPLITTPSASNSAVHVITAVRGFTVAGNRKALATSGGDYIGGLVGSSTNVSYDACHTVGISVEGKDFVGGLIGLNGIDDRVNSTGYAVGVSTQSRMQNCSTSKASLAETPTVEVVAQGAGTSTAIALLAPPASVGSVTGINYVGGLIGGASGCVGGGDCVNGASTALACTSDLNVTGTYRVGGLIGSMSNNGTVTQSSARQIDTIIGAYEVGGLVGYMMQSHVTESYAQAAVNWSGLTVTLSGQPHAGRIGGLIGGMAGASTVTNSYALGAVSVRVPAASTNNLRAVGGLVGYMEITQAKHINTCYADGVVDCTLGTGAGAGQAQFCHKLIGDLTQSNLISTVDTYFTAPPDILISPVEGCPYASSKIIANPPSPAPPATTGRCSFLGGVPWSDNWGASPSAPSAPSVPTLWSWSTPTCDTTLFTAGGRLLIPFFRAPILAGGTVLPVTSGCRPTLVNHPEL